MPDELRALARSVFCVGYHGSEPQSLPTAELGAFGPGAIIVFARNVASGAAFRESIARLRTCGSPPPLIAIDQEGGRVARISDPDLCVQLPAPMALAATGDTGLCELVAQRLGADLARLGVSVNFAPCADLAREPRSTVIGTRSFGDRPAHAAEFAVAFARGLEAGGIAAAIKHFPGHGSTDGDSHVQLARIATAGPTLRGRDLLPFAAAISARAVSIVMSAHIVFEAFDPLVPATLSAAILTGLLREELGFSGLIATDCLEMDAIAGTIGTSAGAVAALKAGADLLLVSHRLDRAEAAADAIVTAIAAGDLPCERLEAAAYRVRALRERFAILNPSDPEAGGSERVAAQRAVTVLRGHPLLRADRAVTVMSFEGEIADGAAGMHSSRASLSALLRARRYKSELMRVALEPDADDIALLLAHIATLGDRNFIVVMRRAHLYPAQARAIEQIVALVPQAILVSAREPYDAALFASAATVICIYGDEELSLAGCADVLTGAAIGAGRLPVSIDRVAGVR